MSRDALAIALQQTLISPAVADHNLEPANVVDVLDRLADAILKLASAIEAHQEKADD